MSYLSVLSRAIRSYAFSQRAVAVLRCVTIAGSNQKRDAGAHRSAGKPGWVSGGRCRAAARRRATKNPPLPKGGQRGNVNTGSFRMSSGAVHVALAISVGSKSGAGHRGFRPAGKQDRGRVPVPGRGEKADDKKSPFAKGGQRGNVNTGSFRMSSGAVHVALATSAGSKSGAGHRKNPSVRGCCSPGSGGRAP